MCTPSGNALYSVTITIRDNANLDQTSNCFLAALPRPTECSETGLHTHKPLAIEISTSG